MISFDEALEQAVKLLRDAEYALELGDTDTLPALVGLSQGYAQVAQAIATSEHVFVDKLDHLAKRIDNLMDSGTQKPGDRSADSLQNGE
jgi:alpha/beta superfamily hydrolase